MMRVARRWFLQVAAIALFAAGASAADLRVLGVEPVRAALNGVAADWSHETGHRVSVSYAAVAELRARIAAGERADLVILPGSEIEALDREGFVQGGARREIGAKRDSAPEATSYAAAVLKGAPSAGVAGMLLDHLVSESGRKAFRERGFTAP